MPLTQPSFPSLHYSSISTRLSNPKILSLSIRMIRTQRKYISITPSLHCDSFSFGYSEGKTCNSKLSMGNTHPPRPKKIQIPFKQAEAEIRQALTGHLSVLPEGQRKQIMVDYDNCMQAQFECRLIGCLFGSIIGDALGAYCEFQTTPLSEDLLEETMEMRAGGVFRLYEGQFTDDSEMAFHLLRGLGTLVPRKRLEAQYGRILMRVAKQYVEWEASAPFDIGITCRKGIQVLATSKFQANGEDCDKELYSVLSRVKEVNGMSQSNGSLMRIAPMAVFLALIQEDPLDHADFIKNQIALIHCNEVLKEAGLVWVKVLYDLIIHSDGKKETYHRILTNAQTISSNQQVKNWFEQAKGNEPMPACENMGWAKIAWTYGIGLLHSLATTGEQLDYQRQIKKVIGRGGDSDTNAAIVGGLLGSVVGFRKLPGSYLSSVFKLQFPEIRIEHRDRPKHYQAINVLQEFLKLFRLSDQYREQKKQAESIPRSKK